MDGRQCLKDCRRIVVKVGTSTVTYPNGKVNLKRIEKLAQALTDLRNQDKDVVLVSSGAIGVGSQRMSFNKRPETVREKQAAAAVGQAVLMQIYQNFFNEYSQMVAQILLTKEDIMREDRRKNVENTFETLFEMGIIPIVNANDTISTYEIEISDNDKLSALAACIIDADLLIILTDIDALYDSNPRENPDATRIPEVLDITDEIARMAGGRGSRFSVGGMETKLDAARICSADGIDMVIGLGEEPGIIHRIIDGEDVGTYFASR